MVESVLVLTDAGRTQDALLLFEQRDSSTLLSALEVHSAVDSDLDQVTALVVACCNLTQEVCEHVAWLTRKKESLSVVAVECTWSSDPNPPLLNVFTHMLVTNIDDYASAATVLGPSRVTLMRKEGGEQQPVVVVALRASNKTDAGMRKDALLEDLCIRVVLASCSDCQILVLGEASERFVDRLRYGGSADRVGIKRIACVPLWQPARFADIAPAISCADGVVCTDSMASTAAAIMRVPTIAIGNANSASYLRSTHMNSQSLSQSRTWMQAGKGALSAQTRAIMRLQNAGGYLALTLTLSRFIPSTSVILDPRGQLELDGIHRSGWQYVLSGLRKIDNASYRRLNSLLVDTYLDRTFGRASPSAYSMPWTGFIHHPFDTTSVSDTAKTLISSSEFMASLPHCKCLFVMSSNLAHQVTTWLEQYAPFVPPIVVVMHPTQLYGDIPKFNMDLWRAKVIDGTSRVVQVGAWLRVPDAIAQLQTQHAKTILCAPHTEVMCRPSSNHSYSETSLPCVTVIETLSDTDYDTLLSDSVVFLRLHDAVAVNTILECIARNTPIVVNRLPATEEYLGADYPGLYDDDGTDTWVGHASALVESEVALQSMTEYLAAMDKSRFSLSSFIHTVHTTISTL